MCSSNKADMEKKRIIWLDIARGLAMLCVIYGHISPRSTGISRWIYSWHMPVFFLITGILLSTNTNWKQMTYRELFIKDLKSILYPYLIFNFIELIRSYTSSLYDVMRGLIHFCILDGLRVLWFLSALFFARQFFFHLMKRTQKKEAITACVIIVMVVTSMMSVVFGRLDLQNMPMRLLFRILNIYNRSGIAFIFLILGFTGANYLRSIRLTNPIKGVVLVCMLLFSVFFSRYSTVDLHYSIIGNPLFFYPLAIAGSVFVFVLSEFLSRFRLSEIIRFMGCNSIVFFVTHNPVRHLLVFLFPSIRNNTVLYFLVLVTVEYGVTWVVIRYLPFLYRFPKIPTASKKRRPDKA